MQIYDLMDFEAKAYEQRQSNVLYQNDTFKMRIIVLEAGGRIPACHMDTHVLFSVVQGTVRITRNGETAVLKENQVCITEPATLSMESDSGARLMGIQIKV
ncbi:MAG: hypothetical protein PHO72_10755 [Sphaerochaeta sp.]|jgi:mannose-6-phosphate isomerase-like protein (cupin superfamily)|nr:hypothetical protein [Sphaerochaeta sp.]